MQYKPIPDRLTELDEYEEVREKDEEILKRNLGEDVRLFAKFKTLRRALLEMLEEIEIMRNGHQGCINVFKHLTSLLNDEVRAVYFSPYRVEARVKRSAAAGIKRVLTKGAYLTGDYRMGSACGVLLQKQWFTTLLRGLTEVERRNYL